jgi:hypothetical protein
MQSRSLFVFVLAASLLTGASCHDEEWESSGDASAADAAPETAESDAADASDAQDDGAGPDADAAVDATMDAAESDTAEPDTAEPEPNPDCDPLVEAVCALPWPSSLYLAPDPARETGYTLTFGETTLPANTSGVHMSPEHFARLDGYGVGTSIVVSFEDLDVTALPGEGSIAASLDPSALALLFEVTDAGLVRVPYWFEPDSRHPFATPPIQWLRPAVVLSEATRYVVAFRGLTTTSGAPVAPSPAFAKLRDGDAGEDPLLAPRQARMDEVFALLEAEGIERSTLVLAWDFVTASCDALHGPMRAMRAKAFAATGEDGPVLTVDKVEWYAPAEDGSNLPVDPETRLRIEGTFRVPDFTVKVEPGYLLSLGDDGLPEQTGWRDPRFWLMVPHTEAGAPPLELMLYGHGMFGDGDQTFAGHNQVVAKDHGVIYAGASLTGFSGEDSALVVAGIHDVTNVVQFTDRQHQGIIEYLLLGRALKRRTLDLAPIVELGQAIEPEAFYYSGISQGGIYGATYMALTDDTTRGHLGVPGSNYGVLMQRSVDFKPFYAAIKLFYPYPRDQAVLVEAVHGLWDMTDPVSYYRHIESEPFPDTPPHQVLLAQAQGDWQVANITNETIARSGFGVALLADYGRAVDLVAETPYPHEGSGLVNYAFGNPWPAPGNIYPDDDVGDPHDGPRHLSWHNEQMMTFLRTGVIVDVCGGDGCTPD